ncbi:hypothetical protein SAMN04487965_0410 [Microbulbifer donghaiensis]|uniref:Uncharacterized protein n=1 Tax=Microbulbifer donghaiensis TaxID=494016 RepID=A0A1M4VF83_9GAMM|nr:hypothetical protein [Microbulbifer donghaiensis]SHE67619.1 hypothetical protein SAMN04487965_0410 [Microbulbifer donghaiensis]
MKNPNAKLAALCRYLALNTETPAHYVSTLFRIPEREVVKIKGRIKVRRENQF